MASRQTLAICDDIAGAALASLDLDGADPGGEDVGQDVERVEAGRLLDGVTQLAIDLIAPFAEGRIAGGLGMRAALDEDAAEPGLLTERGVAPFDMGGRGAGAIGIGRLTAGIGGQQTASLDHDAETAEAEDFDRDRGFADQMRDLGQRQHARHHDPLDAEMALHEVDRRRIGRRTLHREMQIDVWIALGGIVEHAHVGEDDGVHAQIDRAIDGGGPAFPAIGLGIGVDGDEDLDLAVMGIVQTLADLFVAKVQAGEVTRVGVVAKAEIDGVGAIDRRQP